MEFKPLLPPETELFLVEKRFCPTSQTAPQLSASLLNTLMNNGFERRPLEYAFGFNNLEPLFCLQRPKGFGDWVLQGRSIMGQIRIKSDLNLSVTWLHSIRFG